MIEQGVFGKFANNEHKHFLGDFISIGNDTNKAFALSQKSTRYKGHHTGLTKAEMILPLIIIGNNNERGP